jgi:hypothetical protein
MGSIAGNDQGLVEKDLLAFGVSYSMKVPILVGITLIPLKPAALK